MAEENHVISQDVRSGSHPDRNLALELVRVTEAGALAAGRWIGRGEKESADGARRWSTSPSIRSRGRP